MQSPIDVVASVCVSAAVHGRSNTAGRRQQRAPPPSAGTVRDAFGDMVLQQLFRNRADAGQKLASELLRYRAQAPLVLGVPRGGVPVAREVARVLDAPLDVWVVRKVGAPGCPEFGVGAVAEGGEVFVDAQSVREEDMTADELRAAIEIKQAEVEERCRRFRRGARAPDVTGRTVIVVDDGIARGGTARAALRAIRKKGATRIIFAVPVGSIDTADELASDADDVVCLEPLQAFAAVGLCYQDFQTVTDDDVLAILDEHRSEVEARKRRGAPAVRSAERGIAIDIGNVALSGDLALPPHAQGLVLFAHGSGSRCKSPRNRSMAETLRRAGLGTLFFDLLTREEEEEDSVNARLRFDIDLLAQRLAAVTDWVRLEPELRQFPLGYFGENTGSAAALMAAVEKPEIRAVVSRSGRPDLASRVLGRVRAPTLLIVGEADHGVLDLNRAALRRLGGPTRLEVVQGATHLFEEPGALEQVADLAADWFAAHLRHASVLPTSVVRRIMTHVLAPNKA